MKKILFLCTQNACRSQMAEAIVKQKLGHEVETFSAGTAPTAVHSLAIKVLGEKGIDISDNRSKHINEFKDSEFDLVVTLCKGAAKSCPFWSGQGQKMHIGFDDPASVEGDTDECMEAFRFIRDRMSAELVPAIKKALQAYSQDDPKCSK